MNGGIDTIIMLELFPVYYCSLSSINALQHINPRFCVNRLFGLTVCLASGLPVCLASIVHGITHFIRSDGNTVSSLCDKMSLCPIGGYFSHFDPLPRSRGRLVVSPLSPHLPFISPKTPSKRLSRFLRETIYPFLRNAPRGF